MKLNVHIARDDKSQEERNVYRTAGIYQHRSTAKEGTAPGLGLYTVPSSTTGTKVSNT